MIDHIQDRKLLRALDGELAKDRQACVTDHLAACWICRTRLHDLEGTIDEFVHVHIDESQSVIPNIDGPRALLRARIATLEAEAQRRSWGPLGAILARWRVFVTVAAALVLSAIAVQFFVSRAGKQGLSAAEVLSRAAASERIGLQSKKQPVIYQKLQIKIDGRKYDRTTYLDKTGSRSVTALETAAGAVDSKKDTVLAPVERAFKESALDWQEPLSPSRLNLWRAAQRARADSTLNNRNITEISTRTPAGPIAEILVRFRNTDFHPISETLKLRDNSVVEIAELDYRVLELNELRADLFGPLPAAILPGPGPSLPSVQPAATADLGLEIEVVERLDRASAFLGDQISVERQREEIFIHGVVDDQQRKNEIISALGSTAQNSAVKVAIVIPDEAQPTRKNSNEISVEGVEELQKAPADDKLHAFFAGKTKSVGTADEAAQHFAADVSMHSQLARSHALALKQIAGLFSAEELRQMSAPEHRQWREMLRAHALSVLSETRSMRENLEPIFRTNAEDKRPLVTNLQSDADLVYAATKLSELASSNDSAVWHSFAASTQASKVTLVCLPEFWDSLLDAEVLAQEISADAVQEH
jgi:hypothetical protein